MRGKQAWLFPAFKCLLRSSQRWLQRSKHCTGLWMGLGVVGGSGGGNTKERTDGHRDPPRLLRAAALTSPCVKYRHPPLTPSASPGEGKETCSPGLLNVLEEQTRNRRKNTHIPAGRGEPRSARRETGGAPHTHPSREPLTPPPNSQRPHTPFTPTPGPSPAVP